MRSKSSNTVHLASIVSCFLLPPSSPSDPVALLFLPSFPAHRTFSLCSIEFLPYKDKNDNHVGTFVQISRRGLAVPGAPTSPQG